MTTRTTCVVVSLALLAPATALRAADPADPSYRDGTPPVLSPTPTEVVDDAQAVVDAFAEAYRQRGQPRLVLFWNRALTDQLVEQRRTQKTFNRQSGGNQSQERQSDGTGGEVSLTEGQHSTSVTERTDETTVDHVRRAGPAEGFAWAVEDAVVRSLAGSGANLVDRSAAMRFVDAERAVPETRPDALRVEAEALLQKGDVLLEILSTPEPKAPSGLLYRVLVKEVGSGRLLASLVTDARPKPQPTVRRLRVTEGGLAAPPVLEPSVGEVARELSKQVLRTLTAALQR